jgi:hypothetical protein
MTDQIEYISYIIDHNPLCKIFPVTNKSNHGIDLAVWYKVAISKNLNVKIMDYQHKIFDHDGYREETRKGLFLSE